MKAASRLFCGPLLALVWLAPAEAGEWATSPSEVPASGACRTGLDGVTTCIRIRGYVRAGDGFPAASAPPVGGAFAPPRFGYSAAGLGSAPQPGASLGSVRVYIDGSDPKDKSRF